MALLSVIKSNLKAKKGNFISLFILVFIIALSLSTIISVNDGTAARLNKACNASDIGDMTGFIPEEKYTPDMLSGLKASPEVSEAEALASIVSSKITLNGNDYGSSIYMTPYEPDLHSYEIFAGDKLKFMKDNRVNPDKGQVYVPICFKDMFHCRIGDPVIIDTENGPVTYRIQNFIEEPFMGSSTIGFKMIFMNKKDFKELYSNQDGKTVSGYKILSIYLKDGYKDNISALKKTLNERTGFVNAGVFTLTRIEANNYTLLYAKILGGILWAFAALLFIIILIIIGHSVSTGIEMDYVPLGILKAQGFTSGQIRLSLLAVYLTGAFAGGVAGVILSSFVIKYVNAVFIPITGLLINGSINLVKSAGVLVVLFLFISLYTLAKTRKVTRISPVQAISLGRGPVYFSGRMDFPLTREAPLPLSLKMVLKQLTGNSRRYLSGIIIMAILVFFTITVTSLSQMTALDNLDSLSGSISGDIGISYQTGTDPSVLSGIKEDINGRSPVTKEIQTANMYFTVDGQEYLGKVTDIPENIIRPLKGRLPKYDNEILLTGITSKELGKSIGDTVTLEYGGGKADFMIVGINQNISDVGKNFSILISGVKRLKPDYAIRSVDLRIEDRTKSAEIVSYLREKYKAYEDRINITDEYKEITKSLSTVIIAIDSITAITYVLALLFAAIVSLLLCHKLFIRERSDMGILKSIGFTTKGLRQQFTLRFLTVVFMGSLLGMAANFLCNNALMSLLLSGIGLTHFVTSYSVYNITVPVLSICGFGGLFSWLVSGRIKRVSPKNLIQE